MYMYVQYMYMYRYGHGLYLVVACALLAFLNITLAVCSASIRTSEVVMVSHSIIAKLFLTEPAVLLALELVLLLCGYLHRLHCLDFLTQLLLYIQDGGDKVLDCVLTAVDQWLERLARVCAHNVDAVSTRRVLLIKLILRQLRLLL